MSGGIGPTFGDNAKAIPTRRGGDQRFDEHIRMAGCKLVDGMAEERGGEDTGRPKTIPQIASRSTITLAKTGLRHPSGVDITDGWIVENARLA